MDYDKERMARILIRKYKSLRTFAQSYNGTLYLLFKHDKVFEKIDGSGRV